MTDGKRIPVIVLTSSRNEDDRAMSYEKGVTGSTVKRVSFEKLGGSANRRQRLSRNVPPPPDAWGVQGRKRLKPERRDA